MAKTAAQNIADDETDQAATGTELVLLVQNEKLNPVALFKEGGSAELLAMIKTRALEMVEGADPETDDGRKLMKAVSRDVSSAKARLEEMQKSQTEDLRKKKEAIDAEGRKIRTELEKLRDDIKAPALAVEQRELARITAHKDRLARIAALAVFHVEQTAADIEARLDALEQEFFGENAEKGVNYNWQEFNDLACEEHNRVYALLDQALAAAQKREDEQRELEELRASKVAAAAKEQAEKEAREREEAAATKAREEAQAKIQAESERAARAELEKKQAEERAAKAEADAKRQAEEAAEKAAQAERDRQAEEKRKAAEDEKAREADKAHRATINREALACIMQHATLTEQQGIAVLTAIAKGHIKHVKITY